MEPFSLVGHEITDWWLSLAGETPQGAFVEFGVYRGGTAYRLYRLAEKQGRELYLFDTFSGIPYRDEIDNHLVGDFSDTSIEEVRKACPNARLIIGVFPDSFRDFPQVPISFCHVDADQYRSVRAACECFSPLMVKGGVMVFDDYNCLPGATKAVDEFFAERVLIGASNRAYVQF